MPPNRELCATLNDSINTSGNKPTGGSADQHAWCRAARRPRGWQARELTSKHERPRGRATATHHHRDVPSHHPATSRPAIVVPPAAWRSAERQAARSRQKHPAPLPAPIGGTQSPLQPLCTMPKSKTGALPKTMPSPAGSTSLRWPRNEAFSFFKRCSCVTVLTHSSRGSQITTIN